MHLSGIFQYGRFLPPTCPTLSFHPVAWQSKTTSEVVICTISVRTKTESKHNTKARYVAASPLPTTHNHTRDVHRFKTLYLIMLSDGSHQYWIWGSYHTFSRVQPLTPSAGINSYEALLTCCLLFKVPRVIKYWQVGLADPVRNKLGDLYVTTLRWVRTSTVSLQDVTSCCFMAALRLTWRHRWAHFNKPYKAPFLDTQHKLYLLFQRLSGTDGND